MAQRLPALTVLTVLLLAAAAGAQPRAGDCFVGPGLGATLLIPYFEVDLSDPAGVTTLLSVNNGLSDPALARVVTWTDWGIPTLAFDVYLEGFDVQTINVRNLFDGILPSTGEGADLSAYDFCDTDPPYHPNPVLTADERGQLAADHTGELGPMAIDCVSEPHLDDIARGYVTVDVVDECSGVEGFDPTFTPVNTSWPYFAEGGASTGIATTDNVLWGDVIYVDFANDSAQGSEAVAIWADPAQFAGDNVFTFYGRYSGWDGRDERVPLPYRWDQRFLNGGPFAGGADLIVWRGTGSPAATAVDCEDEPGWWPLADFSTAVDEDADNFVDLSGTNFDLATQRVDVASLPIPYPFGWIQVDTDYQTWVQPTLAAGGRFSALFNGTPVEFLCDEVPNGMHSAKARRATTPRRSRLAPHGGEKP